MAYRKDFFPDSERRMLEWTANFARLISISPQRYGIPLERSEQYVALQQAFEQAYRVAKSSGTRTTVSVMRKNDLRKSIERMSRVLAKPAGGADISDGEKMLLGLKLPNHHGSRVGKPGEAPNLEVVSVVANVVTVRLTDANNPRRRGRPPGVHSATIMTCVGDQPSPHLGGWTYHVTSKTRCPIAMGPKVPAGSKVWIAAVWQNKRGQSGPISREVYAYIQRAALPVCVAAA